MLLNARTDQSTPLLVLPFVLRIRANNVHVLQYIAVVAKHLIVQAVVIIFSTNSQVALHRSAGIGETVLQTSVGGEVGTAAVGVEILHGAEVTLATYMLDSRVGGKEVPVVSGEPIERQRACVNVMAQLLGYIRLVRLEVDMVASAAIIGGVVVLGSKFAVGTGLEEHTCTGSSRLEQRCLAEAVVVAVIGAARTVRGKQVSTDLSILRHDGRVEVGVNIVASVLVDLTGIGEIDEITHGLLGDDIHHACNGVGTIHRRTATTHDLYTVDHRRRHLLQTVHSRH